MSAHSVTGSTRSAPEAPTGLRPSGNDPSRNTAAVAGSENALREWLSFALRGRGNPTRFARDNNLTDEQVLAFLRGSRPPEPRVLDAIGYRRQVSYYPCSCYRCTKARTALDPGPLNFGQPIEMCRMFLCANCGNKRCPHAADHRLDCTGSNEPGQAGSLYENTQPASAIEARSDKTGTGLAEGESATPQGDAQT